MRIVDLVQFRGDIDQTRGADIHDLLATRKATQALT